MREFTFSDEDLKAIAHDRYHHPHPHVQRKMEVLWLKSHALPHQQIADLAGVSLRTVQRHLDDYLEGGLTLLRRCKWRGPKTVLLQHERSVEEYFWDHPPRSRRAMASASWRSHLVLEPWAAFMPQAWPRTKATCCSRQVSASQYQANMHSQPTTRSGRKGAMAWRKASGVAAMLASLTTLPLASRTHRCSLLACRSMPA